MQWQSWSQIWQDSTLLSALRRWWQSLTRLRFCGHLFLDCSCGPKSFRRLGARDNLYEDDSHDQSIQILWRSYKRQLHDFLHGTLRLPSCVAELRVKMCQPDVIFWKILNGRIWFPTRTEKYSDLICTSFQDKKLLSNQHFGRATLQKLRQCPLDLSSARSLLGPTPSPNFHKIPDRRATSFNELQRASMSFNELQRVRIGSPSHPITGSLPQPPNTALVKSAVAALVCQWSWRTVASLRFAAGGRVGQFGCFDSTGWSCRDHLPRPLIVCQFAWRWRQYIILLYKH